MQSRWSYKKSTATDDSREIIGKINKKETKSYQKKVDRDLKDLEGTSEGVKDGKKNADSVEEYTDQRCVQNIVKSAENARRKTNRETAEEQDR